MVSVVALVAVIACAVACASVAAWSAAQSEVVDARGRRAVGVNLALSGVQGVVMEVARQRRDLLRGSALSLTGHTVVWTSTDAAGAPVNGVVRLVPLGSDGAVFQMEAAKLDVNLAGEDRLKGLATAGVGALSSETLSTVVSGRGAREWGSLWEIVAIGEVGGGATPAAGMAGGAGAAGPASAGGDESVSGESRGESSAPEFLTCYSADPQERSGFTAAGAIDPDATGRARLVLPETWSDDFQREATEEIGDESAVWLGRLAKSGRQPKSASELASSAAAESVDSMQLAGMLDALEFDEAGTRRGLVDLLTAPAEVLAGVPGIPAALADRIVAGRAKLEASRRGTALWPVLEGLVELKEYAPALDYVTSRCLVYRVIVEGGVVRGEMRGEALSWALEDRWAYEAIVDASEAPVRIAYLRSAAFDRLVIPGSEAREQPEEKKGEVAEETASAEPAATSDMSEGESDSPAAPTPVTPSAPEFFSSSWGSREVDSTAKPTPPTSGPSPSAAPSDPARSRIGRWTGGGGKGSGGPPK